MKVSLMNEKYNLIGPSFLKKKGGFFVKSDVSAIQL